MTDTTHPHRPRAPLARGAHSPGSCSITASIDQIASAMWPCLPRRAARALYVALVLFVAVGVLVATEREVHAQPTEVLVSNANPPASPRLLLVNMTQRRVAQEFTTGSHPTGYDIYAVAVRTEQSNGKRNMGLQGIIRSRRWEPVGPWSIMLPHRQVGPTLTRSRPVADLDWTWFMSPEPIHLEADETYFFELVCRWGCYESGNRIGLGLTDSNDEDESTLPGWSMADGFIIRNSMFNRWWGDLVVGTDGFFHPNPQGPVLRLAIRGEPRESAVLPSGGTDMPEVSASDVLASEAPHARLAFPVTLSSPSATAVTVRYSTADGTATAGADYVATAGRLVFAPGQTQLTIEVPVVHDTENERAETLTLRLSGATGARLADAEATGTIVNAGPGPREWLARFGEIRVWQVADVDGRRLEGGRACVMTREAAAPSPDTEESRPAHGSDTRISHRLTRIGWRFFMAPSAVGGCKETRP